jgi:glycosyltransferase involved in cell wall biosynthesis
MKVALVAPPFISVPPQKYGGTELFIHSLCEGLVERGVDVTLFATGDSKACARLRYYHREGIWPPDPLIELQHLGWAMHQASLAKFDIVHVHSPAALAFQSFLGHETKLVYTLHHNRKAALSRYYHLYPEVHFVAISYRQKALEFAGEDVPVIHHGLVPAEYRPSFKQGDYLLYMGRIAKEKGTHLAIDCARMAGKRIIIAGEAHEQEQAYFKQEIKPRLDLPGVEHVGEVGGEQKLALLRNAFALVFPIQWEEPFGLVMIEAMLSGTPVVGFKKGAAPEVIDEGVTGHLVPSGDIHALALAVKRVNRIDRRNCRERAEIRFSHRRMADEYLNLYKELGKPQQEPKLRRA